MTMSGVVKSGARLKTTIKEKNRKDMKKIYLAAITLFAGVTSLFAQSDLGVHFITVKAEGESIVKVADVADGTVINVSEITDNGFDSYISAGIGAENTSDGGKRLQLKYEVKSISSGQVQACVFSSCTSTSETGVNYVPNLSATGHHISLGVLKAGHIQDLAAEWFPGGEGSATMTFTLLVGTKTGNRETTGEDIYDVEEGPSVTVNFLNGVTGIADVTSSSVIATEYYDMTGRKVSTPAHGIYVARQHTADGKTVSRKVAVK